MINKVDVPTESVICEYIFGVKFTHWIIGGIK